MVVTNELNRRDLTTTVGSHVGPKSGRVGRGHRRPKSLPGDPRNNSGSIYCSWLYYSGLALFKGLWDLFNNIAFMSFLIFGSANPLKLEK